MSQQRTFLKYNPYTGENLPPLLQVTASLWREVHGMHGKRWLYNPWTGEHRDRRDSNSDPKGLLIIPPGEPIHAAADRQDAPVQGTELTIAEAVAALAGGEAVEYSANGTHWGDADLTAFKLSALNQYKFRRRPAEREKLAIEKLAGRLPLFTYVDLRDAAEEDDIVSLRGVDVETLRKAWEEADDVSGCLTLESLAFALRWLREHRGVKL